MATKSATQALLECKCPRCRQGDMFKTGLFEKWYDRKMHDTCSVCNQMFEPEPGFYFGAMYVSYGFSVALAFIVGMVLYNIYEDPETWLYVSVLVLLLSILWPFMYRYSRSIFIHGFGGVRFDNKYKKD
ncbi:MAG: DUF983 domain-containing protein [Reichenbachiella sp.]